MRISDILRFAFYNIKKHKSRTIFTIIIVWIIGLLTMGILCLSISFAKNMNTIYEEEIKSTGATIEVQKGESLDQIEYGIIQRTINSNSNNIEMVYGYGKGLFSCDFRYSLYQEIDKNLSNTNSIYLNSKFKSDYNVGDTYILQNIEFIIFGFIDNLQYDYLIDFSFLYNNFGLNTIIIELKKYDNYSLTISNMKKLYQELCDKIINQDYLVSRGIELISRAHSLSLILISLASIFIIIILLMSIGCIVNTVKISVDENSMFIGIMSVLGVKNKDILIINILECFCSIIVGVIISYFSLIICSGLLKKILYFIFTIVAPSLIKNNTNIIMLFPFYVPLLCGSMIILFTILFSIISFKKTKSLSDLSLIDANI
ncbi:MAG: FtsX-like permease family protein [Anaeroplasma sp.]